MQKTLKLVGLMENYSKFELVYQNSIWLLIYYNVIERLIDANIGTIVNIEAIHTKQQRVDKLSRNHDITLNMCPYVQKFVWNTLMKRCY